MPALSTMAIGSTVKLKVNGVAKEFLVVNQGKPSSMYDESCNGTWLLMKDIYENRQWHSSNYNDYENSTIDDYLNGTWFNLLDANIRSVVKQVRIPYRPGAGYNRTPINSGGSGLLTRVFLLSSYEVGYTAGNTSNYAPQDGARLAYFNDGSGADPKRVAYLNGSATRWWLRSPYCDSNYGSGRAFYVNPRGNWYSDDCSYSYGVRPALILPSNLLVSGDGSISTNTAPSTPGSITVPGNIMGGSDITVKWSASKDAEGNLAGYKVERSDNGGSSWNQIYQGGALQSTDNVAFGTPSVMYRVKAYDKAGLESGYKTSSQVTVVNNRAPSAPPSISVPNDVKGGGQLTITWSAASDPDGNLTGYILERCINGGSSWQQVFKGNSLSHTDTITKGWTKVKYRVKSYDKYDATSGWTTSAERTVDNNSAPTISCSAGHDLGKKTSGFSISYTVDDVDAGDTVTVTEKMDGTVKRTFTATKKASNSFAVTGEYFQKLLNGRHNMVITATDGKATTEYAIAFDKSVTSASITLEAPMAADAEISICAITVGGAIPDDATYTVEVTNNGNDPEPVWEDCTAESKNGRNFLFKNKEATAGFAFNFRVTAKRGPSGTPGHITSIQGGFQ